MDNSCLLRDFSLFSLQVSEIFAVTKKVACACRQRPNCVAPHPEGPDGPDLSLFPASGLLVLQTLDLDSVHKGIKDGKVCLCKNVNGDIQIAICIIRMDWVH